MELRPCPFCGVIPTIRWEEWKEISDTSGAYVLEAPHRDVCFINRMNGTNNTGRKTAFNKQVLIDSWNYRWEPKQTEPQTMLNDGTLVINVEDATKVGRVLVGDDKNRGGLYYPDYEDESQTEKEGKR